MIEDVGDNWKYKVQCALDTIKKYDGERYNIILKQCNHISFWGGEYSTTEDSKTIVISRREMLSGNLYNISAIIVHETYHLMCYNEGLDSNFEESLAYFWEYEFLLKIPNIEPWLIDHAKKQHERYKSLISE